MKKYKVLWIDDVFEQLDLFYEEALANDIVLFGYKSFEEAFENFEYKIFEYDAILLDALFFKSKNQVSGSEDLKGLSLAKDKLAEFRKLRSIPYFILSGQTKLENNDAFSETYGEHYKKQNPSDVVRLFENIKSAADNQVITQIRHDHQEIFSIFSYGYLPAEIELQVLELIKAELPVNRVEIKSMLTNIRSIHESCLLNLEYVKVIPKADDSLNNILRHLSGNKVKKADGKFVSTTTEYQNDAIENLNKWLYFTCGKYIHNLRDENYNDYMISKYAVESLRSGLLELLLWFKKTYEENK